MRFSEGKNRISRRAAMTMVVFVVLVAFSCLTGCSNGRSTRAIAVSDEGNNRVLIYNYPITANGQSANVVLGQADFVSNGAGLSATGMDIPDGTAVDHAGNLYIADAGNQRLLIFKPPFTNGMAASVVIGQPDFVTNGLNLTQNGLSDAFGLAIDGSGNLWVSDFNYNRVLEFVPPFTNGMNATLVIGQANFTSNATATTSTGLSGSGAVAFDHSGNLWVTDLFNNRVLAYVPPFATGMAASLVIGQADFVSGGAATTAAGLDYPLGIAFDGAGNLWIGDSLNNRVLAFVPPFTNGQLAIGVLGQPDFVTGTPNLSQSGFSQPSGLAFDSKGRLAVADFTNNRTMAFKPPYTINQLAEGVLGQPDFVTATATTTAVGEAGPVSITPLY
jgi:sugar lactone lactonase YvrE